jgi:hypothetical protein
MKTLLLTLVCLFCLFSLQAHTLNGIVTDNQSTGIPGAKVTLLGDNKITVTNGLGEFVLTEVHLGDSIAIEYIGYEKLIVLLDDEAYFRADYAFMLRENVTELSEVVINGKTASLSQTANIDLTLQPVRSSQELLTLVPGLFIAQHAGGGKAEQLFLRGFDIDHGTDVALSLDGMPVNMVSHAHGQGYADMHFILPEVIEKIDFAKGPYDATKGNFATAGHVDFQTKDLLERNTIALEYGMFDHKKITSTLKILDRRNQHAYFAADYLLTDGYFDSPQDFNRINLFAKYSGVVSPNFTMNVSASLFQSSWNASGQIPERAVQSGLISPFGAIDNTEGGQTSRFNLQLGLVNKLAGNAVLKSDFFASGYGFDLYSNFTFFLEDSINGDQIRQTEDRRIYGAKSEWKKFFLYVNKNKLTVSAGAGFRYDDIDNIGLAATSNRKTVRNQLQLGNIDETNLYGFVTGQLEAGKLVFNLALRGDNFHFYYENLLDSVYRPRSLSQSVLLPKLSIIHNTSDKLQLFLKSGIGYHSNDTRVVLTNDNPDQKVLPLAYGTDLGFTLKPVRSILVNAAVWHLFSEQEFVYVGDAGIVEPSGRSQRLGFDLGVTYQPLKWLFLYSNLSYAHARAVGEPAGEDYIPLAPVWTSNGKLQVNLGSGVFASLAYRYMSDRAANEDNSIQAKGYFVNDLTIGWQRQSFVITGIVNNVFNVQWKETQFLTESRLQNELQPVEEIHFTPGTPFAARVQLKFLF